MQVKKRVNLSFFFPLLLLLFIAASVFVQANTVQGSKQQSEFQENFYRQDQQRPIHKPTVTQENIFENSLEKNETPVQDTRKIERGFPKTQREQNIQVGPPFPDLENFGFEGSLRVPQSKGLVQGIYRPIGLGGNEFFVKDFEGAGTFAFALDGKTLDKLALDQRQDSFDGYIVEFFGSSVQEYQKGLGGTVSAAGKESKKALLKQRAEEMQIERDFFMQEIKAESGNQHIFEKKSFSRALNAVVLDLKESEVEKIRSLTFVKSVSKNFFAQAMLNESVPLVRAPTVWAQGYKGERCTGVSRGESSGGKTDPLNFCQTGFGVKIGIVDTGVDYTHPDLGRCFGAGCKVIGGYDFVNNDNDPFDDHGHGTHVAAIAAGNGELKGIAPDAKIIALKALDQYGFGTYEDIISAIEYSMDPNGDFVFDDHLDVLNISLGKSCIEYNNECGPNDPLSRAVDEASDAGVIVAAAAGNCGPVSGGSVSCEHTGYDSIVSPGTAKSAITVGSTSKSRVIAQNSSRGFTSSSIKPDVLAPGENICSAWPLGTTMPTQCAGQGHMVLSGTSMAAPHVAGIAALLKQYNALLTPKEAKDAIKAGAIDLGLPMRDQGFGFADALNATKTARLASRKNAPQAEITEPITSMAYNENTEIIGTSKNGAYSVYFSADPNAGAGISDWEIICRSDDNVEDGVLCNWDTSKTGDGLYILRIVTSNENNAVAFDDAVVTLISAQILMPAKINYTNMVLGSARIYPAWEKEIFVTGTASAPGFLEYLFSFCKMDTGECFPVEIKDPKEPVSNGLLGEISISGIETGYYDLQLTVNSENAEQAQDFSRVYIDAELAQGWPADFETYGKNLELAMLSQPTVAEMEPGTEKDIVFAYGKKIIVFASDGTSKAEWQVDMGENCVMQYGPSIADIGNAIGKEIIAGDTCGYVHVFESSGNYLNENWPKKFPGVIGTTSVADVDGDGKNEILFGTWNGQAYAARSDGSVLPGWPATISNYKLISNALLAFDIDNDGQMEIIADAFFPGQQSLLYVFNSHGQTRAGWPKVFGQNMDKALADLDNDGDIEIVAFGADGQLHAFDSFGNELPGFPKTLSGLGGQNGRTHVTLADIDNNGFPEIIISSNEKIAVLSRQGVMLEGFPVSRNTQIHTAPTGFALPGQLDLDQSLELSASMGSASALSGRFFNFYAFNHQGNVVDGFPKAIPGIIASDGAPIADLEMNGKNELVAGPTYGGKIYVWRLNGNHEENPQQFFYNERHSGGP